MVSTTEAVVMQLCCTQRDLRHTYTMNVGHKPPVQNIALHARHKHHRSMQCMAQASRVWHKLQVHSTSNKGITQVFKCMTLAHSI